MPVPPTRAAFTAHLHELIVTQFELTKAEDVLSSRRVADNLWIIIYNKNIQVADHDQISIHYAKDWSPSSHTRVQKLPAGYRVAVVVNTAPKANAIVLNMYTKAIQWRAYDMFKDYVDWMIEQTLDEMNVARAE